MKHDMGDGFWTFEAVEERMVEAMRLWWRSPAADARFAIGGRISSLWQQMFVDRMALIDQVDLAPPEPRALPLTRADIARRDEATEWFAFVPERDRRLVAEALASLAGGRSQVPWRKLKHRLGIKFGEHGLRKRYSRALTCIANALNGAENCIGGLSR